MCHYYWREQPAAKTRTMSDKISRKILRQNIGLERTSLFRLAYAWTHDKQLADDLVQESLVTALAKMSQLKERDSWRSWLRSILVNRLRNYMNRRKINEDVDTLDLVSHEELPDESYSRESTKARILEHYRLANAW